MEINLTYTKLSIHEKINVRTNSFVNRKNGLALTENIGRFQFNLNLVHNYKIFYEQPYCLRKHNVSDKKYLLKNNAKF